MRGFLTGLSDGQLTPHPDASRTDGLAGEARKGESGFHVRSAVLLIHVEL
jgi:hypothetical protein